MENIYSDRLSVYTCPHFKDFSLFPLYRDQLIVSLTQYTKDLYFTDTPVTASMINNYVKLKMLPAPAKKRYDRAQIATLYLIFLLKPVFSAEEICRLVGISSSHAITEEEYEAFCHTFETALHTVFNKQALTADREIPRESERIWSAVFAVANRLYITAEFKAEDEKTKAEASQNKAALAAAKKKK